MARTKDVIRNPCVWCQDEDGNWHTACDHVFVLNDGTPSENDMEFCCYCGKRLKQRIYK